MASVSSAIDLDIRQAHKCELRESFTFTPPILRALEISKLVVRAHLTFESNGVSCLAATLDREFSFILWYDVCAHACPVPLDRTN